MPQLLYVHPHFTTAEGERVKCPACGEENPSYVIYCGRCGEEIPEGIRRAAKDEPEPPPVASDQSPESPAKPAGTEREPMIKCAWCGTENRASARYCSYCGKNPVGGFPSTSSVESYEEPFLYERKESSGALVAGGVFAVLAGVLALGQGIIYMAAESIAASLYGPTGFLCFCGGLDIIFGLAAIGAGIFAFQRRHFGLAVVGALLGMLGLGLLIGFVFGLIALIIIAVSREHFEQ